MIHPEHNDENKALLWQLQELLGHDGWLLLVQQLRRHIDDDKHDALLLLAQQAEYNAVLSLLQQLIIHNLGDTAEHDNENNALLWQLQRMWGRDNLLELLELLELLRGRIDDDKHDALLLLAQQMLENDDAEAQQIAPHDDETEAAEPTMPDNEHIAEAQQLEDPQ
jgi:hypothetical protein